METATIAPWRDETMSINLYLVIAVAAVIALTTAQSVWGRIAVFAGLLVLSVVGVSSGTSSYPGARLINSIPDGNSHPIRCLLRMALVTKCLPVFFIPEQSFVSSVRDDVVHVCSWLHVAFLQALHAERVFTKEPQSSLALA